MDQQPSSPPEHNQHAFEIDPSAARPARLHNYLLGGDGNFTADREVAG